MNDAFLRQRLNQLTGLTKYSQKTGSATVVPASTWTGLDLSGISTPTDRHLIVTAYSISSTVSDTTIRVVVDGEKIFPYSNSMEIISGVVQTLLHPLQIPVGHTFSVEAFSATGGSVTVDFLSVIEIGNINHA